VRCGAVRRGGSSLTARERAAAVRSERAGLFLSCFLLICIVVVTVPFVCCSVKLPLFRPTGFLPVSFHSPPHHGGGRGGRVVLLLPVAAETKTLTGAQPEPMSYAMVVLLCRPVPAVAPPACGPH